MAKSRSYVTPQPGMHNKAEKINYYLTESAVKIGACCGVTLNQIPDIFSIKSNSTPSGLPLFVCLCPQKALSFAAGHCLNNRYMIYYTALD
ncbi:hypothetical protein [Rahnella victoriana]|uniref:Uncharacterized protein n=1 Tax=Rahnella victoriana TaxID=1510570 RepID=A0ABS0DMH2_9GAMM|nr:hypothetical protein [Rahnella victoriana]MBF7955087.1 hypothetical protein [Rahnella victoriana]TBX30890.1 hypothetical protein EYY67_23655 [Rahnella victoriana]UHM90875.1 hypothetical protein J9880_00410 [Rahnella victoriana]